MHLKRKLVPTKAFFMKFHVQIREMAHFVVERFAIMKLDRFKTTDVRTYMYWQRSNIVEFDFIRLIIFSRLILLPLFIHIFLANVWTAATNLKSRWWKQIIKINVPKFSTLTNARQREHTLTHARTLLWWMTCRDQWRRRRRRCRRREPNQRPAGCCLSPSCPWRLFFFFFSQIKAKCQTFLLASISANLFLPQLIHLFFLRQK